MRTEINGRKTFENLMLHLCHQDNRESMSRWLSPTSNYLATNTPRLSPFGLLKVKSADVLLDWMTKLPENQYEYIICGI
jgi:hypothetical protein